MGVVSKNLVGELDHDQSLDNSCSQTHHATYGDRANANISN